MYFINKKFKNIINHNFKNFKFEKYDSKNKILIEFNNWSSLHIASSYLLKSLQDKYKANIYSYAAYPLVARPLPMNLIDNLKWNIGKLFSFKFFGVYKSIGVKDFIYPKIDGQISHKSEKIFKSLFKKIRNNRDIENITINNIWIGDLIYDSFLKYYTKETININDTKFKDYLKQSICLFLFWEKYFNENKVKSIIISHSVYFHGLFARISFKKKNKVYVCHPDYINSLSEKMPFARSEFFHAKKTLRKINKKILKKGIIHAKTRVQQHIDGKKIDIWWTKKNPFLGKSSNKIINKNKKFKCLIACHSFIDSPHVYGNNLFPDNYIWLDFIGKNTINSKHEWYLKPHPYLGGFEKKFTKSISNRFIKKYPHIKLIPFNVGHNQLIKEGINCVFTVLGSIGFEYPLFNIPVINASQKSSTLNFDFNIHTKSTAQYRKLLLNPDKIKLKINQKEILEYYFMRHIYYPRNWLFNNIQKIEQSIGSYSLEVYDYWIKNEFKSNKHKKILNNLRNFINSDDYILGYKFMDRNIFDDLKKYEK